LPKGPAGGRSLMATSLSSRRPSARETAAAATVCLALGAALFWLIRTQERFSPAVAIAFQTAASAPVAVPDLVAPWPSALRTMSAPETFTSATLSDKIDGKAEVYLTAGLLGLRCQRAVLIANPASWIELYVFDMGKPENAFSVFSSQKRTDVTDLQLADYAYRAGNQFALVHGQYYVELVATDEAPATMDAAVALSKAYVAATAVAAHADVSAAEARFPREGLVAGSVELLSTDVFGYDGLKDVFVAHYTDGKGELTLYIARRSTAAEATAAAGALLGFFIDDCGGKEVARPPSPAGAVIVDTGGTFEGVFSAGPYLAGVHQAASRESVERWMRRLGQDLALKP
jgi:hypothetical protein